MAKMTEHDSPEQLAKREPTTPTSFTSSVDGPGLSSDAAESIEFVQQSSLHVGPLPSAEQLKAYAEINPELPERIVLMAEREQSHRHTLEQQELQASVEQHRDNAKYRERGQNYALLISIFFVLASVGFAGLGAPIAGSVLGGATLLGIVSVFVTGRRSSAERELN